jgi:hypothetical protein
MFNIYHANTERHIITRPMTEDMKQHVAVLAKRRSGSGIPLSFEFVADVDGVEYANIYNNTVFFGIGIDDEMIYVLCDGFPVGRWTNITSFAAEAVEVMLMSWRQALVC